MKKSIFNVFAICLLLGLLLSPSVFAEELTTDATKSVKYQTHVQNEGWQGWKFDGDMSGTSSKSLRLEGISIETDNNPNLGIEYATHVENIGWQEFASNGQMSGTSGQALRLESIKIRLTGPDAKNYNVWYQVHAQNYGWLDWAKNGAEAGTEGFGWRLEGIRIVILPAYSAAPGESSYPYVSTTNFVAKVKGDWYNPSTPWSIPDLKINGNPYQDKGLLWLGSKYYECRYRVLWVAQDGNSGVFEAYEQNYYQPPNWNIIPISVSQVYNYNADNTITESGYKTVTYVREKN